MVAKFDGLPSVNIRPTVSVYATYRRISYKPWYAIAEFVDNSTQNYYEHRADLMKFFSSKAHREKLRVLVDYDSRENILQITDNANGMDFEELTRALVLDRPPPVTTGRCEFGMGLKTAACWFGPTWSIETARLGSGRQLTARVHVPDLVGKLMEEIPVDQQSVPKDLHFTRVTVKGLYKKIKGRTTGRIKEQLGSMYRVDLRSGEVEIFWNGEAVSYEEPPILVEKSGDAEYSWRKSLDFDVHHDDGNLLHATGWVGIRNPGNQRLAGFALLRRGRVIVGGPGEGYKPEELFGQGNTFRSQRLVGELNLDQWPVTQAKDAFDWSGGLEDELIDALKSRCQDYCEKAEGLRVSAKALPASDMELAADATKKLLASEQFSTSIQRELVLPEPVVSAEQAANDLETINQVSSGPIVYTLSLRGERWIIRLHWQGQLSDSPWMSVAYPDETTIDVFLNTAHPFFSSYFAQAGLLELLQKVVVAIALVEKMVRRVNPDGRIEVSEYRNLLNRVLRYIGDLERESAN